MVINLDSRVTPDGILAPPNPSKFVLRLYVAGQSLRSLTAIDNIRRICRDHLGSNVDLEIIDVYKAPEQIMQEQIVVTPTLIKLEPAPSWRIIGDLRDETRVLIGLGLASRVQKDRIS